MVNPQQVGVEQQAEQYKQQLANAGFSGTALLDVQTSKGIFRIKLNVPPDKLEQVMTAYTNMLTMSLRAMNLEVKTHVEEKASGRE